MNETEKWWQSRTVWAGIISVVAVVLKLLKVDIQIAGEETALTDAILPVVAGVAGLLAVIFRIVAKKQITS